MELEQGKKAPPFTLPISLGGTFQLETALLRGPVVLNFIRGTWCQFCTDHINKLAIWKKVVDSKPGASVTIAVISNETSEELARWQADHPVAVQFLSDQYGSVAMNYGFRSNKDEYSRPAMVVIDQDGTVRLIDDGLRASSEKGIESTCKSCIRPPSK